MKDGVENLEMDTRETKNELKKYAVAKKIIDECNKTVSIA